MDIRSLKRDISPSLLQQSYLMNVLGLTGFVGFLFLPGEMSGWIIFGLGTLCAGESYRLLSAFVPVWRQEGNIQKTAEHGVSPDDLEHALPEVTAIPEGLARKVGSQLKDMKGELEQVRRLMDDAITELMASFNALEQESRAQHGLITDLTGASQEASEEKSQETAQDGDPEKRQDAGPSRKALDFEAFLSQTNTLLEHFMENILDTSTCSMRLVEKMADVNKASRAIQEDVGGVGAIAEELKLLAVNARIEAARAREMGPGFAVVADRVRDLADQSNCFAEEISVHVKGIVGALKTAGSITDALASKDMGFLLEGKKETAGMMSRIKILNEETELKMDEISQVNVAIKSKVDQAVRALQFEDLVSQLLGSILGRTRQVQGLLEFGEAGCSGPLEEASACEGELEMAILPDESLFHFEPQDEVEEGKKKVATVSQEDMDAGSIEFF